MAREGTDTDAAAILLRVAFVRQRLAAPSFD